MYTLKPPLKTNCSQCHQKIIVNFCPPLQHYSNKNNWGYWTGQKKNQLKYRCDSCLIDLYRNHKLVYLDSITESKKRRTFRAYFGGKVASLLTKNQQRQLEQDEFRTRLEQKGINLQEDGLGDYLENWRQTMLNLVQANARQAKKIQELEKKLAKKEKKSIKN